MRPLAREEEPVPRAAVLAPAQGRQGEGRHGEPGCGQVAADRVQRAGAVVHDERGTPHGIADPHGQVGFTWYQPAQQAAARHLASAEC